MFWLMPVLGMLREKPMLGMFGLNPALDGLRLSLVLGGLGLRVPSIDRPNIGEVLQGIACSVI